LPAEKDRDHDSQLDDQVRGCQQKGQGRDQPRPFGEQRTHGGQGGEGARAGDEAEEGREANAFGAAVSQSLLHSLAGNEDLDHAGDHVSEPEGRESHPEQTE
jgi:hypothetical protein